MNEILKLEQLGYSFAIVGGSVRYRHDGERPDPERVRPLLEYLKRHREMALDFLLQRDSLPTREVGVAPTSANSQDSKHLVLGWVGQHVKIEDLPAFKEKWDLRAVGSEWLEGDPCPTLFFQPVEAGPQSNGKRAGQGNSCRPPQGVRHDRV